MGRIAIERSAATRVVAQGRELLYFGGCDYLGLAHDPRVVDALRGGALRWGVSAGASRETTGDASVHGELEADIARRLGLEAAVLLPDGYTANLAAVESLAGEREVALIDEHAHPSLYDAAAAAGIGVQRYAHGDATQVRARLRSVDARTAVVMTDSVFPMRGEIAPIAELIDATRAAGARLVLDDCHGTGVIGERGRGALEHACATGEHVIVTSTLSKALGCYGGFVAGSRASIERVCERSQVYVTTTPIPPAVAAAALAALELALGSDALVRKLRENVAYLRARCVKLASLGSHGALPVLAIALPPAERMRAVSAALQGEGILAPYVRYPGGPPDGCIRIAVTAAHSKGDLDCLTAALAGHLGT